MHEISYKRLAIAISAVAITAALALPQTAAQADDPAAPADCIIHGPLKGVSHVTPRDNGPKGPSVGDTATYTGELYDASGAQVGTYKGTGVLFFDVLNNEWAQVHTGHDKFNDGTVFWNGTNTIAAAIAGQEQTFFAVGATGRYLGKIGQRKFSIVDRTDVYNPVDTTAVTLCKATVVPTIPLKLG